MAVCMLCLCWGGGAVCVYVMGGGTLEVSLSVINQLSNAPAKGLTFGCLSAFLITKPGT